jgi:hypothetical protein
MENWKKAGIITLISLAIGGIYLFSVFEHRRNAGVAPNSDPEKTLTPDDVAIVRTMLPTSFDDVLKLENTSVWMKNGYTMPYFAYAGGRIEFAKQVGVIPTAQRLDIKKVIKAAAPETVDDGISHGSRQVFAVFAEPGGPALYATAIGVIGDGQEEYFSDILFYYDDPHTIYDNWPAIDAHKVLPGMSELETRMSIGQKTKSDGGTEGNRTLTYDQAGKQWTVTFVNNRATTIKAPG